jgi:hypothetical protein
MSAQHERIEADREDLLAEATALVDRVELVVEGFADPIVVGFRRQGGASVYFGADVAYHFAASGALRRAFCDGLLFRADGGRLASLERRRTSAEVELVRHDLDDGELQAFLDRLACEMQMLKAAMNAGKFAIRGQVSERGDVLPKVVDWVVNLRLPPPIAQRPNAG